MSLWVQAGLEMGDGVQPPQPLLATHPLQTLGTVPTACFLWAPVLKAMRRAVCSVGHGVGEVPLTATANPHPGMNRVSTGWSSCRGYQVVVALHPENAAQLPAHRPVFKGIPLVTAPPGRDRARQCRAWESACATRETSDSSPLPIGPPPLPPSAGQRTNAPMPSTAHQHHLHWQCRGHDGTAVHGQHPRIRGLLSCRGA